MTAQLNGTSGAASLPVSPQATAAQVAALLAQTTIAQRDDRFRIIGSADATKGARFEVDGIATGVVRTVTIPNRDITAAGTSGASVTGRLSEFNASGDLVTSQIQDGVTGAVLTIAATLTLDRAWAFPNRSDTVAGLGAQIFTGAQQFTNGTESAPGWSQGGPTTGGWRENNDLLLSTSGIRMVRFASGAMISYRASLSAPLAGSFVAAWAAAAYDGTAWDDTAARIRVVTAEDWTGAAHGCDMQLRVRRTGTTASEWTGLTIAGSDGTVTIPNAGTAASPAIKMVDVGLGPFRPASNIYGIACAGVEACRVSVGSGSGALFLASNTGATDGPNVSLNRVGNGTNGGVQSNDRLGFILVSARHDGGSSVNSAAMEFRAAADHTSTSCPTACDIQLTSPGSTSRATRVRFHGDAGIQVGGTHSFTSPGPGQLLAQGLAGGVQTVSTTGNIAALDSSVLLTRLTGATPVIQGIAAPAAGARMIRLYCVNAVTLNNEDAAAAAANRIASDTGANISVAAGRTIILIYDTTSSRWRPCRWS